MDTANTDNGTSNGTFPTAVVVLSACSSSLSILGSLLIFGTYIFIPDIRNSTRKLVTCLTAADLLTALGYLTSALAHFSKRNVCVVQSVITTYSSLVSFYLTVAIAVHISATVVYRRDITSSWKFLLLANIVSWIIPGIIVSVAGQRGVLGISNGTRESVGTGPWCWLKRQHSNYKVWMFLTGKGWEFLCYLLTTSLYVLLKFYLYLKHRFQSFAAIHQSLREDDQNYLYVWFVLYVLRLWGSIRSMMSLTGVDRYGPGNKISKVFMYMQAVGDPGQAFCNCVLFCFLDSTVRSHLFSACSHGTQRGEDVVHDERSRLLQNDPHYRCNEDLPYLSEDGAISGSSGQYSNVGTHGTFDGYERKCDTSNEGSKNVSVQSKNGD